MEFMLINGVKEEKKGSTMRSNEGGGRPTYPITFIGICNIDGLF